KISINTYYTSDWFEEHLPETTFGEVRSPQRLSVSAYQEYLNSGNWVEFIYDAPVPFGIFENGLEDLPTDYENRTFTHVMMNKENPEIAGFYDSHNEFLYQIDATEYTEEMLDELLYAQDNSLTDVEAYEINERFIYLPVEEQEVEYRDYLVERLPNNLFVLQFFSDTSEVDTRRTGTTTRYIDLTTEVRINDSANTLTYLRQRSDMGQMTLTERLQSSYQTLTQIENWTERVHYHDYTPETNEVTFQRYIQGFPVYSYQQFESQIDITVVESGLTSLQVPVRVVQTPLTLTGERTKTLQSGQEVIAQLETVDQALESIEDIRIGLTWVESEEDERVVHFEPDWYVEAQDTWIEVDRFIEAQEAALNGF
ncbi:MAG: two-component system activity regulator YycH, partial [Alkalibacterium sp.]